MMLVQLFLPVYDNGRERFPKAMFDAVRVELADRFGGVTAYLRSPAAGLWEDEDGDLQRDDVLLFEVMVEAIERDWWRQFREGLERRFRQEEILLRASACDRL
jgi:crotonobetainyl-CoA:carnitine CoA-transferase CaiB-like acyl-CoA transferase